MTNLMSIELGQPATKVKAGERWLVRIGDGPIMKVIVDECFQRTVQLRLAEGFRNAGFHLWHDVTFIERVER